jgi:hypothetical protein
VDFIRPVFWLLNPLSRPWLPRPDSARETSGLCILPKVCREKTLKQLTRSHLNPLYLKDKKSAECSSETTPHWICGNHAKMGARINSLYSRYWGLFLEEYGFDIWGEFRWESISVSNYWQLGNFFQISPISVVASVASFGSNPCWGQRRGLRWRER